MCTIIISAGQVNPKHKEDFLQDLRKIGTAAERQGSGATGLMYSNEKEDFSWIKRPVPCGRFVEDQMITTPSLLGIHARSGGGYPDNRDYDKNHHPFSGEHITLMHEGYASGSLRDWHHVADMLGIHLETETDSELLMRMIDSRHSLEEGIERITTLLYNWVVGLAIYDDRTPDLMHFFSLSNRCSPYDICRSEKYNTTMLISSSDMIVAAGVDSFRSLETTEPYCLYSFDRNGNYRKKEL